MSEQRTALQVVLSRNWAGTERMVAELSCALRERGWRSLIATTTAAHPRALALYAGVSELHQLPVLPAAALVPALTLLIRRRHVDLVNGHLGNGTAAAIGAATVTRIPALSTVHFVVPRHATSRAAAWKRPAYRQMLRRASAVIAVSEAVRPWVDAICARGGPEVHVVHNGVGCIDADRAPFAGAWPRDPVVVFAGRLNAEKQVHLLIEAMAGVPAPARLRIAGRGAESTTLRILARRLLGARAEFLGFVDDVAALLRSATVLALPSLAEPFGVVALEAMRAGTPVVGFAAGALPEVVVDGETGLLVPGGDVPALAAALRRLMSDVSLAQMLGEAGVRTYESSFTARLMAERTSAVYESLL
ncbi:MAG: glycosyltransferase family 4 protein [Candidatus Dormibacteraeota bacterium]|nr:glycosyltransferase family 4 protein [Candidatus Dormibacteraeota bacterium]